MPIKKTVKKTSISKNPVKKTTISNSNVVVETKKTNTTSKCSNNLEKIMKIVILWLLSLNIIFALLNVFKKDSALKLEELKVGGPENMKKVVELYNSDIYKEQQTAAIQEFMNWQQ